jgi:uncharacterized phage-associated protein
METFDDRKCRELVLYVAERSRADTGFGATKLHKILYYADMAAYRQLGHSISGAEYRHMSEGPWASQLPSLTDSMRDGEEIKIQPILTGAYVQKRVIPLRTADTSVFSTEELALVDKAIGDLWRMSAKQVSNLSHQELGWRLTRQGEVIPYRTAWLSAKPLTDAEIQAGREIAAQHGLLEPTSL